MDGPVVLSVEVNGQAFPMQAPACMLRTASGAHTVMELEGIVAPQGHRMLYQVVPGSGITVAYDDGEKILLEGLIEHADVREGRDGEDALATVSIRAASYSILLDRQEMERAFQDTGMSCGEIAEIVLAPYPDHGVILGEDMQGKRSGRLAVQYGETDWAFLSRIASWYGQPMFPSNRTKGPKVYMGAVWSSRQYVLAEDEEDEVERADQCAFRFCTERTDMELMGIGEQIVYKGMVFYIKEAAIDIRDYGIRHCYLFCRKEGFYVPPVTDHGIKGLSLAGTVRDVSGSLVQVDLDIDASPGNDCWYALATFYSMFYCMPEKGDRVFLHFPQEQEGSAFVLNAVRTVRQDGEDAQGEDDEGQARREPVSGQEGQGVVGTRTVQRTVDITPYIDALAAPEGGSLIDVEVGSGDGTERSLRSMADLAMAGYGAGKDASPVMEGEDPSHMSGYGFACLSGDSRIKTLSTPDGKKIVLNDADGSVTVYLDSATYVRMSGTSVQVRSGGNITLWSDQDISIDAGGSVHIGAEEGLELRCKGSILEMVPERVELRGNDIKLV